MMVKWQVRFGWMTFLKLIACSYMIMLCGCDEQLDHRIRYVDKWTQYAGQNGLGLHRRMWEQSGARCFAPARLSNRLKNIDVIVLAGSTFDPPGREAREWMEQWLRSAPGRTVVYFGRDFDARTFYFQSTLDQLSPAQQDLARDRIARLQIAELQERLASVSENTFCEWFYLQTDKQTVDVKQFKGPWTGQFQRSGQIQGAGQLQATTASSTSPGSKWTLRTRLLPPSRQYKDEPPSWLTNPPPANPVKPMQDPLDELEGKLIKRSRWSPEEMDEIDTWDQTFEKVLKSKVLLESDSGEPLVFRLTHDERLGEGKILIVANGAPILNASLVDSTLFSIGQLIVEECLPAKRVALLAYSDDGIQIYDGEEADLRGAGLEMLLTWPLSAITMSAALFGIVAFAYLLPILGRPQDLPSESVSDFGLHVEAIGQMLHETDDLVYARSAIAEYFRRVRGEHPPNWLESD